MACLQEDNATTSKMAYGLPMVTGAPEKVEKAMTERLDGTLGRVENSPPVGPPPSFTPADPAAATTAEFASMAVPSPSDVGDSFQRGVDLAVQFFGDNTSDAQKGFSNVQKGNLMGWCVVTQWKDMPPIWHKIEKAKSD